MIVIAPPPPSNNNGGEGNDDGAEEPPLLASSSDNGSGCFQRCRIITKSRSIAASECRHGRYNNSWPWWSVATILFLTRLSASDAAFRPSWSSVSCYASHFHRRKDVMKSPSQSSSPAQLLFSISSLSCASLSQSPLLDQFTSRQRQRLSSVALVAAQTSNADSSLETPQAGVKSDNLSINGSASQQQQQLLLLLRQLKKFKTNKEIETEIVRLGRKGRTAEALQLYHAVWKLDELRQTHKAEGSQDLLPLFKSKLRPTTRLMNSAIDACARSSPQQVSALSAESTLLLPPAAAQDTKSRTQLALDIFHSGTSSWWSHDDDNDPFSSLSSLSSDGMPPLTTIPSVSKSTTATTSDTTKKRKKKHGGALSPNVFTFGALLACCARDGDISTSLEILSILEEGTRYPDVELNDVIYSTVISACANANVNITTSNNNDSDGRGILNNVEVALNVLNRGISKLYQRGDGYDNSVGSASTTSTRMIKIMGVVGYNAAISTMSRAGEWKMAVQLLGEMILHSSSSSVTNPSTSSSPEPSSLLLQRTNPHFAPMELLRDDMSSLQLLLLQHTVNIGSASDPAAASENTVHDNTNDGIVMVPKPDEVTFGTVLAACERSGEWETLLNVAKAATEYGVKLDGMALTSVLHSCQQLGLAGE